MGCIYKIRNKINDKIYIGQTTQDLGTRWKQHLKKSSNCVCLKRALNKYGIDNFEYELVCTTSDDLLNDKEIEYIENFNCLSPDGYNLRLGGNSGKHNEQTKHKIRETLKNGYKIGRIVNSKNRLGKPHSETTKKKISKSLTGNKFSKKSIKKRVISRRINQNRKIVQFDLEGNKLKEFDSCKEAGEYMGVTTSSICQCLKGKTKTSKGFIWKYETIV